MLLDSLWFATLLFPAVVAALFMRKARNLFTAYIIVLVSSLIVALVFYIIGSSTNSIKDMILIVPVCPAFGLMSSNEYTALERADSMLLGIASISCGGYLILLMVASAVHWKRIHAMDQSLKSKPPAVVIPETADVA